MSRIPIRTQVSPDFGCLGMATTPSRNAGRQETYFYINRERPTSAFGAGPRPHLNFAHLVRARQQPPALTVVVVKPLKAGASVCRLEKVSTRTRRKNRRIRTIRTTRGSRHVSGRAPSSPIDNPVILRSL